MLRSTSRYFPKLRSFFKRGGQAYKNSSCLMGPAVIQREFHLPRRSDPFTQMENFIRDMERKFWNEVDHSFNFRLPRIGIREEYPANFGGPSDMSTTDKYKLVFNFPNAKPEDIKVTLKDRLLTVDGKVEEVTESSKFQQSFSYQYTVPEVVDAEALESIISNEGILTIQAPKKVQDTTKQIPINRE